MSENFSKFDENYKPAESKRFNEPLGKRNIKNKTKNSIEYMIDTGSVTVTRVGDSVSMVCKESVSSVTQSY